MKSRKENHFHDISKSKMLNKLKIVIFPSKSLGRYNFTTNFAT